MPVRPIAYNLVRLILSSIHTTPRGIDRIDFGYLSHLLEHWPADFVGVMPTMIGYRYFSREQVLRGRDRLMALWQEEGEAADDPALHRLIARFGGAPATPARLRKRGVLPDLAGLRRMSALLLAEGITLGRPAAQMPQNAIYLDIGHFGLTFPGAFSWRRARPDVSPVFLIHDAIPLEFPDMVAPDTFRAHRKLMRIVGEHAQVLITPTSDAGAAVNRALIEAGTGEVPTYPVHLPIDDLFSHRVLPLPQLEGRNYFVVCGAVEPRKNHALLFDVWRQLADRLGENTPYLVVAGSPGYRSDTILAALAGDPRLSRYVFMASGMASPALARLVAGARAALMPSFAEGFGLPPIEALAMGVPALLSDIPAHREGAGEFGHFLSPTDRQAWQEVIEALSDDTAHAEARRRAAGFRPRRWPDYMAAISSILQAIEPRPR
ncbi:MAG: glycosyltransferase family 4 protein [Proteobacteria bacterium]|nr:glycosyltransferase family 4 protein [Pseudomonadota bacterium]